MSKIYTVSEIEDMVANNNKAVERGILAIHARQTADEQVSANVRHDNNMGFSVCYARSGTYFARWIASGRTLDGKHLDKARKICLHHVAQLTKIANKTL